MRCKPAWPIILAGAIALPAAAQSLTCTWKGTCTAWDDPDSWTCGCVPGSDDNVVIPAVPAPLGCYPKVNADTTIRSLTVQRGGLLEFHDNVTLTVTTTVNVQSGGVLDITEATSRLVISGEDGLDIDAGGTINLYGEIELATTSTTTGHDIDGDLFLQSAGALIGVRQSMKFIGDGKVEGQNASVQIAITSGKTLTNAMSSASGDGFRGFMEITGAGSFANQGRVEAAGGVFELASSLAGVSDSSGVNRWVVASDAGSELKFSKAATSLAGDFVLSKSLNVPANVYTCGGLTYNTGACIDVTSTSFRYLDYDGGTCSSGNPYDTTTSGCGGTVFVVNGDKCCS